MHGNRGIPLGLQCAYQGIGIRLYIKLVCNGVGRQKRHGIPCKELVLRIACHGTEHRHGQAALYHIFLKAVDEWEILHIGGKIPGSPKVRQTLIHDTDQVHRCNVAAAVRLYMIQGCRLQLPFLLQPAVNLLQPPGAVAMRRLLNHILHGDSRGQHISIFLICVIDLPHVDAPSLPRHQGNKKPCRKTACQRRPPSDAASIP